jgi:preprotein translocase subunit SecA
LRELERAVMLRVIDTHWKDHLLTMDYLKEGIGLRGYGQKDPLVEYKREGYELFVGLIERIKVDAIGHLFRVQAVRQEVATPAVSIPRPPSLMFSAPSSSGASPAVRDRERVGRNDPCPCGSGKKYKKCHGA